MKELIKITKNEEGQQLVSARELHEFLEVTERFSNWFSRQLQYGFIEGVDFSGCKVFNTLAKQDLQDYAITIDMAKEISMIQRTDKGRQARKYFIKCEKKLKEELKSNKQLNFTPGGNIPIEVREMFSMIPDTNKAEMMIKVMDKFYPKKEIDKIIKEKKDKPKFDLKQKAIDVFKECYDEAYITSRGGYVLLTKEVVYKCASKNGIRKIEFNKILLNNNMVKIEREGCATCCTNIYNKNTRVRVIYLKAELLKN